jgi:5-methylcytosine-specific restriction endonuclease McrA
MTRVGYKQTEAHRRKIAAAGRGRVHSAITKHKQSIAHLKNRNPFWGKHHPDETRKRISSTLKGRKFTRGHRAKIASALRGRKLSLRTRTLISQSRIGRFNAHENPNWQGGKSFEPYSLNWTETLKRSIRERDNYACQLCGALQGDRAHSVHHIDYNKNNCKPQNLITLCVSCHARTNYNRRKWKAYFLNPQQ